MIKNVGVLPFQVKLIGGFVTLIVAVQLLFITYSKNNENFVESNKLVAHTREVLLEIEKTFSAIDDVVSGTRGYVISGNLSYLKHYSIDSAAVYKHLGNLKKLTRDNRTQQVQIDTLLFWVNQRLAFSQQQIEYVKSNQLTEARKLSNTNRGIVIMDQIKKYPWLHTVIQILMTLLFFRN